MNALSESANAQREASPAGGATARPDALVAERVSKVVPFGARTSEAASEAATGAATGVATGAATGAAIAAATATATGAGDQASAPVGRLSSSWAVRTALRLRGLEDLPEALIFGLGASAWYRLEAANAPGDGTVLRSLHPERIKQSFFALNVYAIRFNYLSADALAQLRERCSLGAQTLISVDRCALPDAPPAVGYSVDYTLLVHADGSNAPGFRVQGPADAEPWHLSEQALQAAWFQRHGGAASASFYWHPVLALNWDQDVAIGRALHCHAAQMRHRYAHLGATGLRALEALLVRLDDGDASALAAAARCAAVDGPALCRDLLAEFLRHAAQRLGAARLEGAALRADRCAALWRDVLAECAGHRPRLAQMRRAVTEVLAHERAVLDTIDSLDPGEAT